ncbi:MAG: hypothetical protein DMF78_03975 [Acidobacteria bacterium]|nr:MAG: hypothetical protein DMF78_03975 [Acidobacteriota bacterium]
MAAPIDELLATVSDELGAERPSVQGLLAGVHQRARQRARDALRERIEAFLSPTGVQAPTTDRRATTAIPEPSPRLERDRPVEMGLRNGRRLRVAFSPALARRRDLLLIGRVGAANHQRAFSEIGRQVDALERLRRSHDALEQRVADLEERSDRALVGLLRQLTGLDGQVEAIKVQERSLLADRTAARVVAVRQQRMLRSVAASAQIQKVTAVVSSAQSAAYGQKGSVLATNNLVLAGNQLLWGFIDPLLQRFGLVHGPSPSLLAWLAPMGSLLTGSIALGNRQHRRFVSGITTFDSDTVTATESLRTRIADALWPEFQQRTDVPVTVMALDGGRIDAAVVQNGLLKITLRAAHDLHVRGRVAWMLDTGADVG